MKKYLSKDHVLMRHGPSYSAEQTKTLTKTKNKIHDKGNAQIMYSIIQPSSPFLLQHNSNTRSFRLGHDTFFAKSMRKKERRNVKNSSNQPQSYDPYQFDSLTTTKCYSNVLSHERYAFHSDEHTIYHFS